MCTAITYQTKDFYFGRNLDLECSYNETVTVTPRNYPFIFRNGSFLQNHYAMIGMATVCNDYPLYYEATNEKGLSMAGLNFPCNAVYYNQTSGKENITPFELIPWVLSQFESVAEAKEAFSGINLWKLSFNDRYPLSPLHWILCDRSSCLVLEPMEDGLRIYENPIGVLTNNPPFDYHIHNLANYLNLTSMPPKNRFSAKVDLKPFSLGMGAIGLPGDPSSPSRFVRAAFTKMNSISGNSEAESIGQFFHILGSVEQQRGVTNVRAEEYEYTRYSSCCNTDKGIYYYTTYENRQISAVDMFSEDLETESLIRFQLMEKEQIYKQNGGRP